MEAGASLVAFIGFELTSIKTIHHFVTSILDGPQRLQDLARALDSLRAAYERTQALQDLPGILESSPSLLKQLKQCNNDVVRYSKALEKMKIQPGERLHTALRKKFKIPLCEDEIKDMLSVFSRHVNSFMLEISILDMYVDTSSLVEGHITSRSRISQSNSSGISQVLTNNEYQSEMMHQNYTSLQKVQEDMFLSNLKIEHLQDGFDALALKVENLPAVTTQQSNMMLERFAKFERKFNELLLRERTMLDTTHRFVSAFDIAPAQKSNAESGNDRVVNSIRRLSSLLDEKDRVAEFDEAQDIIDEIETLLLQMETVIQHRKPGGLPIHRTEFCSVGKEHRKEMKRALGVLRCSPKLTLNPQSWSRHRPLAKRATRRKHDVALYQSQIGQWLVSTRRQWRICETEAGCEEHQEYTATIAFKPTARDGLHHIKVSVQQLQQANGFHTFTPVVSIGRIRPSESCVFQCVRSGLFDEFLWLLATGEASLQDRDEQGAPLLHYAYNQPKICNFLIKNGADVDKLAKPRKARYPSVSRHVWFTEHFRLFACCRC
ncbi:hypothetical protein LZ31DRAFT_120901 [Colletotrichum somersetense]|nr:hypothetical protein LZ31DRAFT_120901 [Colletotrichum somersetense]